MSGTRAREARAPAPVAAPPWQAARMRCCLLVTLLLAAACGGKSAPSPSPAPAPSTDPTAGADTGAPCIKTGCGGTLCSDQEMMSTCEFRPEHACYRDATCERQADGTCGWTETPELTACLANPPPVE